MKTTTQNVEVGIVIARIQTPYLHEGHVDIISQVIAHHPRVIIFLGLSPVKCSKNNPLDFTARKAMLEAAYPNIEVHYIEDSPTDEVWSKKLDNQIHKLIVPNQKVVLYGSRDSFIPHYKGKHQTIELVPTKFISAKEIRKNIGIKSKNTQEFREGVVWAVENQWPSVLPTVDIAIINYEKKELLLARKPDEELLRFVGGFASTDSNSYEDDAKREVFEETSLEVGNPVYIGSTLVNDWRYKHEQNKIKTMLFVCEYLFGTPKADDDIADVRWVKFEDIYLNMLVPNHQILMKILVDYLNKSSIDLVIPTFQFKIKL